MSRQIEQPYEIYKRRSTARPFGVRTRGDNGEVLNHAQGFTTKKGAIINIRATARVANPGLSAGEISKMTKDLTK